MTASISAVQVRELPCGIGSVEQYCDNVNLLVDMAGRSWSQAVCALTLSTSVTFECASVVMPSNSSG